jgi:hypothetical protein
VQAAGILGVKNGTPRPPKAESLLYLAKPFLFRKQPGLGIRQSDREQ